MTKPPSCPGDRGGRVIMNLQVQVLEARGLPGRTSEVYAKVKVGSSKARTALISSTPSPSWYEDFFFKVDDLNSHVVVTVHGHHGFFGQVKVPIALVVNADKQILPPRWYQLQKHTRKSKMSVSGSDHGVKAQGEGWLLSVTLVSGEKLYPSVETGTCDPYVVFTCNGKTRTSSVKLNTLNPEWHEVFEFDATEEAPSTMYIEVFDFEGPFSEAESLGYAEINFLKQSSEELADLWVQLEGNRAWSQESKLHLHICLTNTQESDSIAYYIQRVEKEVGKKIIPRSPQKNSSFQRLFSLPAEEFLINDFACAVRMKLPLQGRLFLSPRMMGFYSNIFGHKTKICILWDDIDEIGEISQGLSSAGLVLNPSILVFTKKGRGRDTYSYSKSLDAKGRFKFQFQSFVHFGLAYRYMYAGKFKIYQSILQYQVAKFSWGLLGRKAHCFRKE